MNKIVKCNFLVIVFILLLNLSFSSCKVGAVNVLDNKKTQKPNIIYILTDDLGYGDIGVFFQNERKKADNRSEPWLSTPNLDKMAQEGAMLNQHYAAAPVCAPSRASKRASINCDCSAVIAPSPTRDWRTPRKRLEPSCN